MLKIFASRFKDNNDKLCEITLPRALSFTLPPISNSSANPGSSASYGTFVHFFASPPLPATPAAIIFGVEYHSSLLTGLPAFILAPSREIFKKKKTKPDYVIL